MITSLEPSLVALTIETAGIALVALLSLMLGQSAPRTYLRYWTLGWFALALGLAVQLGSLTSFESTPALQIGYLACEYVFVYLLFAGCRTYAQDTVLSSRDWRPLLALGATAVAFPVISGFRPALFLIPHAAVVAGFFVGAFVVLRAHRNGPPGPGRRVIGAALVLLAVSAVQYVPISAYSAVSGTELPVTYLRYTSLYDLILEILLGFGMVMSVMDDVRAQLVTALDSAAAARDRLERLSRLDPMTQSLNRHAFYTLVERGHTTPVAIHGCVAVVDVDDLKVINDSLGHAAGDAAIRAAAKAIRSSIRPDDLVFRWGGDEFLVLLFGVNEAEARSRLERLNPILEWFTVPGSSRPIALTVSYGLAPFAGEVGLDGAIAAADGSMYAQKQLRHTGRAV